MDGKPSSDWKKCRIFMYLATATLIVGTLINISRDGDYVVFGIAVISLGIIFGSLALAYASRAEQSRRKEKEEQMKRLEDDIAYIKKKLR